MAEEAVRPVAMVLLGAGECLEQAEGGKHRRSWSRNNRYGFWNVARRSVWVRRSRTETETVRTTDKEDVDESVSLCGPSPGVVSTKSARWVDAGVVNGSLSILWDTVNLRLFK